MQAIDPFYSVDEAQKPFATRIYHNSSECPVGQAITEGKRTAGTNGYEICPICCQLIDQIPKR